jgi:hypothetical protein
MTPRNVYVIRLRSAVLQDRKFRETNPQHDPREPCVYVGSTARDPKVRFAQRLAGYRSARPARRFGLELIPRLYRRRNPMENEEARAFEVELARRLRKRGYAVWQKLGGHPNDGVFGFFPLEAQASCSDCRRDPL